MITIFVAVLHSSTTVLPAGHIWFLFYHITKVCLEAEVLAFSRRGYKLNANARLQVFIGENTNILIFYSDNNLRKVTNIYVLCRIMFSEMYS